LYMCCSIVIDLGIVMKHSTVALMDLARLMKLDDLPLENPLGGLLALRDAWDIVDLCESVGSKFVPNCCTGSSCH
jgi:hypothetical protein